MSELPAVILASAGSGKTHELAGRYIGALLQSRVPGTANASESQGQIGVGGADRILATTFTRKAAGEMFAKVLARLTEAAGPGNEKARAALAQSINREVSEQEARRTVIDLVRRLDRVRVQTLDSFFAEIGRVFAPELGLTPGWRILDEVEIEEAKEQAIDRVCEAVEASTLLAIIENMNGGALPMLPRQELMLRANELHEAFLDAGAGTERWGAVDGDETSLLSADELSGAIKELHSLPSVQTKSGTPNVRFASAREKIRDAAAASDWRGLLANTLTLAVLAGKDVFSTGSISAEMAEVVGRLAGHAAGVEVQELARATRAAGGLASAFDRAYGEVKRSQNAVTFDDLPRAMLTLPREDSEWLSFRLDAKLDHILLDEFQDTSRVQYLVLEPLLREITSQRQDGRSVFAVGDVKQSLYGWRGALPELLAGLSERLGLGSPGTKSMSWRSSSAVLDVVNAVFERIDENPTLAGYAPTASKWKRSFQQHTAAREISGQVRLVQTRPKDKEKSERVDDLVIEEAVDRICAIASERPEWSVGVLTRANAPIPRLIHRLKKRGILAAQDKGHPLTDEPCVNAFLSVMQLAEHPGDSASQFHVGKSAFAKLLGVTSPLDAMVGERVSAEIRSRIARDGIAGLVRWLRSGVEERLTSRGRDRLKRVEGLAADFDARAGGRIPEFIRLVEDSAVRDVASGQVSVLTVHRAKGLEWDAVVLIDLDRSWKGRTPRVVVDRGERGEDDPLAPVEVVTLWPRAELQSSDAALMAIAERYRARQVREELSGLYVAMTRARSRLEMIVANLDDCGDGLSSAAVLRAALGGSSQSREPGEIRRWEFKAKEQEAARDEFQGRSTDLWKTSNVVLRFEAEEDRIVKGKAPSQRKAGSEVREILQGASGHEGARRLGHVWHAWMEEIEWMEDWKFDQSRLTQVAGGFGMDAEAAAEQMSKFRLVLEGPIGQALSRGRYSGAAPEIAVRREWGLVWKEHGAVSGRIDRLVIGLRDGRPIWAEVLDFKTDRVQGKNVAECAAVYSEQMKAYRKAVAGALRLETAQVRSALLFTSTGAVVESD